MEYTFWDVNDEAVLKILAKAVHIYHIDDDTDGAYTLHDIQGNDIGGDTCKTR